MPPNPHDGAGPDKPSAPRPRAEPNSRAAASFGGRAADSAASVRGEIVLRKREVAPLPEPPPDDDSLDLDGLTIGRYRVLGLQLKLGTVKIFSALDTLLGRRVGLRVIVKRKAPTVRTHGLSTGAVTQGLREILALARVSHPHLVPIFDAGVADRFIYWAMELVPGQPLRSYLQDKRLDGAQILDLLGPVAAALAALNTAGYYCGAIDLDHIYVGTNGRAYLWTAGPTSRREIDLVPLCAQDVTDPNDFVRTWVAPEIRSGGLPTARSDVYAFCALLMQALFGGIPTFHSDDGKDLRLVVPRRSRGQRVPGDLAAILQRGLAQATFERFADARELAHALQSVTWAPRSSLATQLSALLIPVVGVLALASLTRHDATACEVEANFADEQTLFNLEERLRNDIGASLSHVRNSAVSHVISLLDARAQSWRAVRVDTCALPHDEPSDRLRDQRTMCLARRQAEIEQVIADLIQRKGRALEGALTTLNRLPSIEGCEEPQVQVDDEPILSEEQRKSAEQVNEQEARARAAMVRGELELAISLLGAAYQVAEKAQLWHLEGQIEATWLGLTIDSGRQLATALQLARRGVIKGIAFHDHNRTANAIENLTFVEGYLGQDMALMRDHLRMAEAMHYRNAKERFHPAQVFGTQAIYAWLHDGPERALPIFAQIYGNAMQRQRDQSVDSLITVSSNYAIALTGAGRYLESIEFHHRALEFLRSNYGPTHGRVATQLLTISSVLAELGRSNEINLVQDSALRAFESEYGSLLAGASHRPEFSYLTLANLRYFGDIAQHQRLLRELRQREQNHRGDWRWQQTILSERIHNAIANFDAVQAKTLLAEAESMNASLREVQAISSAVIRGHAIALLWLLDHVGQLSAAEREHAWDTWALRRDLDGDMLEVASGRSEDAQLAILAKRPDLALSKSLAAIATVERLGLWGFNTASQIRLTHAQVLCETGRCREGYQQAQAITRHFEGQLGPESGRLIALNSALGQLAARTCAWDQALQHNQRALTLAKAHNLNASALAYLQQQRREWQERADKAILHPSSYLSSHASSTAAMPCDRVVVSIANKK